MAKGQQPRSFWIGLQHLIHLYPKSVAIVLFSAFLTLSLLAGIGLSTPGTPRLWTTWFDSSGVFLGWFSMCAGWVAALMTWGGRGAARMSVERVCLTTSSTSRDLVCLLVVVPPGRSLEPQLRNLELARLCEQVDLLVEPELPE